jgi:hypothetical protein
LRAYQPTPPPSELRGPRHDRGPLGAGADARDATLGVDLDALEAIGLDEDHVLERAERLGVVAGALRRKPEPVRGCEPDQLHHVLLAGRKRRERRLLGNGEVVGLGGFVPAGVARRHEQSVEAAGPDIELAGGNYGHLGSPCA